MPSPHDIPGPPIISHPRLIYTLGKRTAKTTDRPTQAPLKPCDRFAVGAADAAALLGVSTATFRRLDSAGRVPRPLHISSGREVWSVENLKLYVRWGCPAREQFQEIKSQHFFQESI